MLHTESNLKSKNADQRRKAILELVGDLNSIDPQLSRSAAKRLTELISSPDAAERLLVVRELAAGGPQAVALLDVALTHPDPLTRKEAATSLGKVNPEAEQGVPFLARALQDPDQRVRMSAATALGQLGAAAEAAIPELVACLADNNLIFCRLAAQAFSQVGPPAVLSLTDTLRSSDKNARREAAWALGQIGPAARDSVPVLAELLHGAGGTATAAPVVPAPRPGAAGIVTEVLNIAPARCDETQLLPPGRSSAPDGDAKVRQAVAQALEKIQGKR